MSESLLSLIEDTVKQYAEVISNVLNVDVEIVDNCFIRIAGTGAYGNQVGAFENGEVYKDVIKNGQHKIVENPREHKLCASCAKKDTCIETMDIGSPIFYKKEIIGVIGLVCTTDEQKQYLIKNQKSHISFLNKIGELIGSKVFEYKGTEENIKIKELLFQVLNSVEDCVLITDSEGNIALVNENAMKQLKLNPSFIGKPAQLIGTNEYIIYGESFKLNIMGETYNLVGEIIPVQPIVKGYKYILIFKKLGEVKSKIIELTGDKRVITVDSILGISEGIQKIKTKIRKVCNTKSTVLILGESGTGKELVARSIHYESERRDKPFVGINCAAIPDTLLESELFGFVRGSFSGASSNGRIGKFELANKGVIFLDEIGDMPLYVQAKLLRVLQERTLTRIGSNELIHLDIRVIAATNKDLKALVKENKFREDLYYRINVIPIEIPPLRNRKKDISGLLYFFIDKYNKIFDKYIHTITDEALYYLQEYPWHGNVRELENAVELMINLCENRGVIDIDLLPQSVLNFKRAAAKNISTELESSADVFTLKQVETEYILKIVEKYGYDTNGKKMAAEKLGIGIATLYRKLNEIEGKE